MKVANGAVNASKFIIAVLSARRKLGLGIKLYVE
jgi:hypothetical protein